MDSWVSEAVEYIKNVAEENPKNVIVRKKSIVLKDDYWTWSFAIKKKNVVKALMRILKSNLKINKWDRDAIATHLFVLARKDEKAMKTMWYVMSGDIGTWVYKNNDFVREIYAMVNASIVDIDRVLHKKNFDKFYEYINEDEKKRILNDFLFSYKIGLWELDIEDILAEWVASELNTNVIYDYKPDKTYEDDMYAWW